MENNKSSEVASASNSDSSMTKSQLNYYFYKEYCRLKLAQDIIRKELDKLKKECEDEGERINLDLLEHKEKRRRRTAHEIERKYECKYKSCPKSYGSEGSLNQHMKNKHPEFYANLVETLNISGALMDHSRELRSGTYSEYSEQASSQAVVKGSEVEKGFKRVKLAEDES